MTASAYHPGNCSNAEAWWKALGKRARNELASICWLSEGATADQEFHDLCGDDQNRLRKRHTFAVRFARPTVN